jgi:hypothetical protein
MDIEDKITSNRVKMEIESSDDDEERDEEEIERRRQIVRLKAKEREEVKRISPENSFLTIISILGITSS